MKISEFTTKIQEAIEKHSINQIEAEDFAEFCFYGLRFENKVREVGEPCENSRHNWDRADERDFPAFGSDEYNQMMELDGTSAWYLPEDGSVPTDVYTGRWQNGDDKLMVVTEHCYIIAGDVEGTHNDPDAGEILIQDAVVVEKLF